MFLLGQRLLERDWVGQRPGAHRCGDSHVCFVRGGMFTQAMDGQHLAHAGASAQVPMVIFLVQSLPLFEQRTLGLIENKQMYSAPSLQ